MFLVTGWLKARGRESKIDLIFKSIKNSLPLAHKFFVFAKIKNMFSFFKKNLFVILLVAITFVICILNYTPEAWLSGWDTLHPEFNFLLNFKRIISGVWRLEQGLGAVAGHSHMADLPRVVILYLFHFLLPLSFLRYSYFFLCLIFGPLGVYFFLEKIIFEKYQATPKKVFSFLGGLFYLLNLGTLQHFFVPFEMFATQYAVLGWLFLFLTQFLQNPQKKSLIYFSLVSFFAAPQAYAATLWYTYSAALIIYLFTWLIINHFKYLKWVLTIILVTLIINSFWLLPNLYYVFQHSGEVLNAKINQLFSQEAFLHNYEYGNLQNVAVLKNHLFSWTQYNFSTGKFDLLFKNWLKYLHNPLISGLGYLFFFIIILGFIISLIKKEKIFWPLIMVFLLCFIFLINATLPFSYLFAFLRSHSSLFKEALRFPFTKFSILLMFVYAVFFAYGLNWLYQIIIKYFKKRRIILLSLLSLITLFLIIFMWSVFKSQLIDQRLRIKIPQEYFETFEWFEKQEDGRILQLPMPSLWGWEYHDWGFQGAGFAWFGLEQPFLTRDFDRWNLKNEKAYQELAYALYAQNLPLFEQLLNKYQIEWLLLDKSIIAPEQENKVLFFNETEKLLSSSLKVGLVKEFNFLNIYHFNEMNHYSEYPELIDFENPPEDLENKALIESINYGQIDKSLFLKNPSQIFKIDVKKLEIKPELCGPALENQVFGLNINNEKSFKLTSKNAAACIKIPLEKIIKFRPSKDFLLEVNFESEGKKPKFCLAKWGTGECLLGGKEENNYFYQFPSNREIKNYEIRIILDQDGQTLIKNLNLKIYPTKNKPEEEVIDNVDLSSRKLDYVSLKEEKRDTFYFPELSHNQSYTFIVEAQNQSGLPLRICITNYTSRHCDLYANLKNGQNIFFIPPSDWDGQGYDINISNYGIGPLQSINSLKSIKIIPLDYQFIKSQENPKEEYITNNQSYEKNWRALVWEKPFKIKSLGKPTLINGWENGWILKEKPEGKILFFFLPQIFEYLGFLFILIFIVLLVVF